MSRTGDIGVKLHPINKYPFERFSDDAKETLLIAQKEAEISQRGYVGTEHILLGLLRLGSGSAYRALLKLGIDAETVRTMIEKGLRSAERSGLKEPIPTTRVKQMVEIAFEESRRMGWQTVESGHLLMGLARWNASSKRLLPAGPKRNAGHRSRRCAQPSAPNPRTSQRCGKSWHQSGL
jgi:ATP-dependent Clp protease ATP-binding subunit ClpA